MLIFSNFKSQINNIINLFYPKLCATCNIPLLKKEYIVCTNCRHDLPLIKIDDLSDNNVTRIFYGSVPIMYGSAFLTFSAGGKTQKLIHQLKYQQNQKIGTFIGKWFGKELHITKKFDNLDYIVPVPLHSTKHKKRGYNQLTKFGEAMSLALNCTYMPNVLVKNNISTSQTTKNRFDRYLKNEAIFELTDISIFEQKHILLIDDVVTTGATLIACCKEISKVKGVIISVATIAYTDIY